MQSTGEPQGASVETAKQHSEFKVFGVGNAGVRIIGAAIAGGISAGKFVAIDLDARSLAESAAAEKALLQSGAAGGTISGGDPERGRNAAEKQQAALKALCEGVRVAVIVTGLGGGAGTGISPVLAGAARESGALVVVLAVLPFGCEATLRGQVAQAGLERLRSVADVVVALPNEKTLALINDGTSLLDAFKTANEMLGGSLISICQAFEGNAVMGLPFSDLLLILRQRSADCEMACAEASGPNRAGDVVDRVLAGPMAGGVPALQQAEAVGVCVLGGPGMTIREVSRVMEQIQKHSQGAPVLMGAAIHPAFDESLKVCLFLAQIAGMADVEHHRAGQGSSARGPVAAELSAHLLDPQSAPRPQSRFLPPPPDLPLDKLERLRTTRNPSRSRGKASPKLRQTQLPLEIVSKGRFDRSEPTIHKGEDLDVPTYIRRGIALN